MTTVVAQIRVQRWRITMCVWAAWALAPFMRSEAAVARVAKLMAAFIRRGVTVRAV
ncbi:hypothetical protein [Rhodovulum viride]|uniref:hypothetical protein n=1 Tax=Rhodovulum viride TaxID=1231134 RepID=UPI0015EB8D3B|nr:hypothetical protein [Rhodovulum viride]